MNSICRIPALLSSSKVRGVVWISPIGQGILGHSQEVKEDFRTRSSGQGARILTPVADGFIACMGVTTPCCRLSGTKFHFKFRWCDRPKKFILADAFCQGCAGKVLMINLPHQTTSFFNMFRTPKPDYVYYHARVSCNKPPGQHVRISKDIGLLKLCS